MGRFDSPTIPRLDQGGEPVDDVAAAGERLLAVGARNDVGFHTNLGLASFGTAAAVEVRVLSGGGLELGSAEVSLVAGGGWQGDPFALVGAVVIDDATGDADLVPGRRVVGASSCGGTSRSRRADRKR